jgi:hypothetical protein
VTVINWQDMRGRSASDAPDDEERTVIMDGLSAYSEAHAGGSNARPLIVLVRDPETKKIAGGLLGRTYLCLLTIEWRWCAGRNGSTVRCR